MMYWIVNLLGLSMVLYLAFKYIKIDTLANWVFFSSFLFRILGGLAATIVFLHIYPASDSLTFFNMSESLLDQNSLWEIVSGQITAPSATNPRVFFFVQILSVFTFISGGSYWIISIYFITISFLSSWYFVRELVKLLPDLKVLITISFLFIPSIIFWSTGILKDTLSFAAVLFVVAVILKIHRSVLPSTSELVLGILSLFVLLNLKHYLLITLLIFAGLLLGIAILRRSNSPIKWLYLLIPITLFIATQYIHPYLKVNRIAQTIYENNQAILEKTNAQNQVGIVLENSEWQTILTNAPKALFTGLFRPTIFDTTPPLGFVHKIENLLLLSLCIFTILLLIKEKPKLHLDLLLPSLFCIAMLATLLALTTPNLGTLVRYKNVLMPFLFLLSSILPYQFLTSKRQ